MPVRYVDLVRRLADEGVMVFVEVGPRQVLTRLHRRILAGRDVAIVACDNPRRPGGGQLLHVQAVLESAGLVVGQEAVEHVANVPARFGLETCPTQMQRARSCILTRPRAAANACDG